MYQEYDKYNQTPPIDNNIYGTVTVGIEDLEINDDGATIVFYIRSSKRDNIKLGMYVDISYPNSDEHLFGRISRIRYKHVYPTDDATEIHSERASLEDIDENDYKLIAYIEPICILFKNENKELDRRMVDKIPKPDSPVTQFSNKLHIQNGLNLPTKGLFLGHIAIGGEKLCTSAVPQTVPYYLRNGYKSDDPLPFRHIIVCGGTGTGKTFFTKNILRQFIGEDVRYSVRDTKAKKQSHVQPCIVILDPQDEYSQLHERNPVLTEKIESSLLAEEIKFGGVEKVHTFYAKVEGEKYTNNATAITTEFTIPFDMVERNQWLLHSAKMNDLQISALDRLVSEYFNGTQNRSFQDFIDTIRNPETKRRYTQDENTIHEATYDAVLQRVSNSHFGKVFDQGATKLTEMFDKIFKPGQISVFPTEYINSERIRDLIILTMMTIIVDNKLNTNGHEKIKKVPIILGLDEAHRYLSNPTRNQEEIIVSKFADAARQGRKECLGLFLITQDPQDIDKTIMKQINTKIVLNLNNESAINSLMIPKKYEKRIPYLKKGQAIVHSPDNSEPVEISGLSTCVVNHI